MKITESKLRRIIRNVIKESNIDHNDDLEMDANYEDYEGDLEMEDYDDYDDYDDLTDPYSTPHRDSMGEASPEQVQQFYDEIKQKYLQSRSDHYDKFYPDRDFDEDELMSFEQHRDI